MRVFGVDIGGSGIKGAPVDLGRGDLAAERYKVLTPYPATPEAVADCGQQVVDHFGWSGPVGAPLPGVVTGGSAPTPPPVVQGLIGPVAAPPPTRPLVG